MSTIDSVAGSESAVMLFDAGYALFQEGDTEAAFERFRLAYQREAHNARLRSYYGLCLGLTERAFEESVQLCESAAKQEFFNPELYLNLARLYLGFGFRGEGVRYLRRGLMIDPGNRLLVQLLREVGDRRDPILAFLPRRHALNRWLGAARHALVRRSPIDWAA